MSVHYVCVQIAGPHASCRVGQGCSGQANKSRHSSESSFLKAQTSLGRPSLPVIRLPIGLMPHMRQWRRTL